MNIDKKMAERALEQAKKLKMGFQRLHGQTILPRSDKPLFITADDSVYFCVLVGALNFLNVTPDAIIVKGLYCKKNTKGETSQKASVLLKNNPPDNMMIARYRDYFSGNKSVDFTKPAINANINPSSLPERKPLLRTLSEKSALTEDAETEIDSPFSQASFISSNEFEDDTVLDALMDSDEVSLNSLDTVETASIFMPQIPAYIQWADLMSRIDDSYTALVNMELQDLEIKAIDEAINTMIRRLESYHSLSTILELGGFGALSASYKEILALRHFLRDYLEFSHEMKNSFANAQDFMKTLPQATQSLYFERLETQKQNIDRLQTWEEILQSQNIIDIVDIWAEEVLNVPELNYRLNDFENMQEDLEAIEEINFIRQDMSEWLTSATPPMLENAYEEISRFQQTLEGHQQRIQKVQAWFINFRNSLKKEVPEIQEFYQVRFQKHEATWKNIYQKSEDNLQERVTQLCHDLENKPVPVLDEKLQQWEALEVQNLNIDQLNQNTWSQLLGGNNFVESAKMLQMVIQQDMSAALLSKNREAVIELYVFLNAAKNKISNIKQWFDDYNALLNNTPMGARKNYAQKLESKIALWDAQYQASKVTGFEAVFAKDGLFDSVAELYEVVKNQDKENLNQNLSVLDEIKQTQKMSIFDKKLFQRKVRGAMSELQEVKLEEPKIQIMLLKSLNEEALSYQKEIREYEQFLENKDNLTILKNWLSDFQSEFDKAVPEVRTEYLPMLEGVNQWINGHQDLNEREIVLGVGGLRDQVNEFSKAIDMMRNPIIRSNVIAQLVDAKAQDVMNAEEWKKQFTSTQIKDKGTELRSQLTEAMQTKTAGLTEMLMQAKAQDGVIKKKAPKEKESVAANPFKPEKTVEAPLPPLKVDENLNITHQK